jgi:hypothetical protein
MFLIWIGILGAPVLAVAIFSLLHKKSIQAKSVIFAGALLVLCFGGAYSGLSFVAVQANFTCFIIAYLAYSFLAVMCWRIPVKAVRILMFVVAMIPIGFGYTLSTIGFLGLAWIGGDYTRPPEHVEQIASGLTCRVRGWGSAGSSSGYAVDLYQSPWNGIPFLERKVAGASVIQDGYSGSLPSDVSCVDVLAKYSRD